MDNNGVRGYVIFFKCEISLFGGKKTQMGSHEKDKVLDKPQTLQFWGRSPKKIIFNINQANL